MKDKSKEVIGWLFAMLLFIFVGVAVIANIYDNLENTNYSYWLNIIGFCLVPIFGIVSYIWYRKECSNTKDG